ncbi:hypothetical protein D3C75_893720 [compost metagenome]
MILDDMVTDGMKGRIIAVGGQVRPEALAMDRSKHGLHPALDLLRNGIDIISHNGGGAGGQDEDDFGRKTVLRLHNCLSQLLLAAEYHIMLVQIGCDIPDIAGFVNPVGPLGDQITSVHHGEATGAP